MIADLHCHYPMHLLADDLHPHRTADALWERVKHTFEQEALDIADRVLNAPSWRSGWRVDLDGLLRGGARIVCSVLYRPAAEFVPSSTPVSGSFRELKNQLKLVEADLKALDPGGQKHCIVKRAEDFDDSRRVAFVHCVEGGFHLGPDEHAIDSQVQWLAEHGVLYITLAHLFFRGVATNAPAIPPLTDAEYNRLCPQPGIGLTSFGRAAVTAMRRHKVLVDISHMREDAIDETFELLKELDGQNGSDPRDFPVLASHVGTRAADRDIQAYNLTDATVRRIQQRGGLVGLITAQHQIGPTTTADESKAALRRHIAAVTAVPGGLDTCAIGSDLDGFIKPTLVGFEAASDYPVLERWIRASGAADPDKILYENVHGVLKRVFAARLRP